MGPRRIVVVIGKYEDYADAIRRKLLRELSPSFSEQAVIKQAFKYAPLLYIVGSDLSAPAAKATNCALALAFALDVSASVNSGEYDIQKGGLAAALLDTEVVDAILLDPGAVWLLAYE